MVVDKIAGCLEICTKVHLEEFFLQFHALGKKMKKPLRNAFDETIKINS